MQASKNHPYLTVFIAFIFFVSTFLVATPSEVSAATACEGDINQDGTVNLPDYSILVVNFLKTPILNARADIVKNNSVDIVDYSAFVGVFNQKCTVGTTPTPSPSATPRVTPTPSPSASPRVTPTPSPSPSASPSTPPISATQGIWISKEEIMDLPMLGNGWEKVKAAANSSWGSADLGNLNSNHDINTMAGALVAVRTNDTAMRNKTIAGIQSAMTFDEVSEAELYRALELSRGLQSYVIAADIIGYRTPEFEAWLRKMLTIKIAFHSGGSDQLCNSSGTHENCANLGGLVCTAVRSSNNWGGHARAAVIATARYLGDTALLKRMENSHRAFQGEAVPHSMYCTDTTWHADRNNKAGVNRKGATIGGHDVAGVLTEDWRRGKEYMWPPALDSYMWEGMQGYVASAVMLDRAGLVKRATEEKDLVNDPVYLAMKILYRSDVNYPAEGDDSWLPWVTNKLWKTNLPTTPATGGKGIGWTEWTHQIYQ